MERSSSSTTTAVEVVVVATVVVVVTIAVVVVVVAVILSYCSSDPTSPLGDRWYRSGFLVSFLLSIQLFNSFNPP